MVMEFGQKLVTGYLAMRCIQGRFPFNYGGLGGYSTDNPAIYIAVASNDGMLRMLRNTTPGGAESGGEAWAFMPRASMPAQTATCATMASARSTRTPWTAHLLHSSRM